MYVVPGGAPLLFSNKCMRDLGAVLDMDADRAGRASEKCGSRCTAAREKSRAPSAAS